MRSLRNLNPWGPWFENFNSQREGCMLLFRISSFLSGQSCHQMMGLGRRVNELFRGHHLHLPPDFMTEESTFTPSSMTEAPIPLPGPEGLEMTVNTISVEVLLQVFTTELGGCEHPHIQTWKWRTGDLDSLLLGCTHPLRPTVDSPCSTKTSFFGSRYVRKIRAAHSR